MAVKTKQEAQNPLILRCHRLMEAFAKSDDERDFYIDRLEGFLIYVDLDKSTEELDALEGELKQNPERYCLIPKLSFYETKKIMEGFVNEKVYDIDTKEKLLDIIQSKEARENFLEFIYDHHSEQEKWQQYYQERSRIRIIEWLRQSHFHFVFEEDLDIPRHLIEKLKQSLFQVKVGKDIQNARKILITKAKTYYSNEALNPRPKRGRPPKQVVKTDIEPQISVDIFTTVSPKIRPFLFTPETNGSGSFSLFSSKFETEEDLLMNRRSEPQDLSLQQKLASLRSLSSRWVEPETQQPLKKNLADEFENDEEDEEEEDDDEFEANEKPIIKKLVKKSPVKTKNKPVAKTTKKSPAPVKKKILPEKTTKTKSKRIIPRIQKQPTNSKGLKKIIPKGKIR